MKILNILKATFFIMLIVLTGCEKFLEEENRQSLTDATFFNDPVSFDQMVADVYHTMREVSKSYTLDHMGTDIITRADLITGTNDVNDYVNFTSENGSVESYWNQQYSIIAGANFVINRADDVVDLSDADKSRGIAEVKFFRAFAYYNLVETFGGVPLVLEEVRSSEFNPIRSSEEEVYNQILDDLDEALSGVDADPDVYGRVSKDAVRHLKAKVLLTRGYKSFAGGSDFSDAAQLAETVIANHPLVSSFADLFEIPNQRNSEVIFSFLYGSDIVARGAGNNRHQLFKFLYDYYPGMRKSELYQRGIGGSPTPFYFTLFEDGDQRKDATLRYILFAIEDNENAGIFIGDTAIYFPETPWTQEQKDAVPYAVINPGDYFTPDGITQVHWPMFKKFDEPGVAYTEGGKDPEGERDAYIFRSGETRLLAAEAYFKNGNSGSAATHINALRTRAGLTGMISAGEVTLDLIMDESAKELMGEVSRWKDLKRTGTLITRTLAHNPHAALNNALTEKHLLRPIPQTEIDVTGGSIVQNPGY